MTLRVCFLIPDFSDGGAQKQCIFLLNALQRFDLHLTLIRFREGIHDHLLETGQLDVVTLGYARNKDPRIPFAVAEILRRTKADIVITWLISADLFGPLVRAISGTRVRWLLTERNSDYPDRLRFKLRRFAGRFADAVISNSEAGDALWASRVAHPSRFVLPNIVHKPATAPIFCLRRTIAYAGRLEPHKNVERLTEAFCALAQRRDDLDFEIIGIGSEAAKLAALIDQHQTSDRVRMPGFDKNLPGRLAGLTALVSLSRHEGLPNVLLEAAAANVPIIASNIAAHRELLGPAYPYLVAPDADTATIARMIEHVVDTPKSRQPLAYALERIALMWADSVAAAYLSIFESVAARGLA